ncbi:hydrogenase expression/formation protein HypE [bacterium]|nr:hydrogenase expression/formation protein HypE [bacterium]
MPDEMILLAHGGGGVQTQRLIKDLIFKYNDNPILHKMDDSACLTLPGKDLVFTTDSYVVDPIFFPGGDIGRLAACGTINDLVMQGAQPRHMSLGLILEEGMLISELEKIIRSFSEVLQQTGVTLVTGDTKVVGKGQAKGLYINTSGIGVPVTADNPGAHCARPGDVVILTGTMGDHGMAVMGQREGLNLKTELQSDVAPLWDLIKPVLEKKDAVHVLRDPTRGGVAAALCDIAQASQVGVELMEQALPVRKAVHGMCDLLGIDPLMVANEGKALVICSEQEASWVVTQLKQHPLGKEAVVIGRVQAVDPGFVSLQTQVGGLRAVEMPQGEMLPRIC